MVKLLAFALFAPVVTRAFIGAPTADPAIQTVPVSFVVSAGLPAYPGQAAIAAAPATATSPLRVARAALPAQAAAPPVAYFCAGGQSFIIPASQMSALSAQTIPSGNLSLTLTYGDTAPYTSVQFAINQSIASGFANACKCSLLSLWISAASSGRRYLPSQ